MSTNMRHVPPGRLISELRRAGHFGEVWGIENTHNKWGTPVTVAWVKAEGIGHAGLSHRVNATLITRRDEVELLVGRPEDPNTLKYKKSRRKNPLKGGMYVSFPLKDKPAVQRELANLRVSYPDAEIDAETRGKEFIVRIGDAGGHRILRYGPAWLPPETAATAFHKWIKWAKRRHGVSPLGMYGVPHEGHYTRRNPNKSNFIPKDHREALLNRAVAVTYYELLDMPPSKARYDQACNMANDAMRGRVKEVPRPVELLMKGSRDNVIVEMAMHLEDIEDELGLDLDERC